MKQLFALRDKNSGLYTSRLLANPRFLGVVECYLTDSMPIVFTKYERAYFELQSIIQDEHIVYLHIGKGIYTNRFADPDVSTEYIVKNVELEVVEFTETQIFKNL